MNTIDLRINKVLKENKDTILDLEQSIKVINETESEIKISFRTITWSEFRVISGFPFEYELSEEQTESEELICRLDKC